MKTAQAIFLLALSPLFASGLGAQDSQTADDLAFALGLAERFKYVDLAEVVLDEVDKRGVSGEDKASLDLTRCKLFGGVARREGDPAKRKELYSKALSSYRGFLDRHPFAESTVDARREYVDLVNAFGRVLEAELENLVGEEAEAARNELSTELEAGLELTGELIDGIGTDASEVEKQAKYRLMISRGQMLLTLAKVSDEPTFLFGQAEKTLENLALDAGETSVFGLQAYLLLGEVKVAQGQYEDAQAFMEYVADIAVPRSKQERTDKGWDEMAAGQKQQRFKMLELGMSSLVNSFAAGGDPKGGAAWGLHMLNIRNADGLTLTPRGDLALLSTARALLSAGGVMAGNQARGTMKWYESEDVAKEAGERTRGMKTAVDFALGLAQDVNDRNKGNTLQIRAQAVISEITERPGVTVSPEILFEAAQGKYYSKQYAEAITAFQNIRGLIDAQDEATQKEYGARTLHFLANSYNKLGRKLEAGLTFREAITKWSGDVEYDSKNASGYLSMMKDMRSASNSDKVFVDEVKKAEDAVIQNQDKDSDPGKILVSQGDRRYGQGDYDAARKKYLEVAEDSAYYEKGLTKAALCLFKSEDKPGAKREFAKFDERLKDASTVPTDTTRQAVRKEASAMTEFYLGVIAAGEKDIDEAIKRLDGYHERFPSQDSYGPVALYTALQMYLAKKQYDKAEGVLDQMVETYPTHKRTGNGAYKIYQVVKAAAGKEPTQAQSLHMGKLLQRFNGLSKPSFPNARTESKLFMAAEAWEQAEGTLERMRQRFSEGPDADKVVQFVLPDLGHCLLQQRKVPEANAILAPLIPDPDDDSAKKPSSRTSELWCRSVTGWLEGSGREVIEVPGIGGAENFAKASKYWTKLIGQCENRDDEGKWSCPWYELKSLRAYNFLKWGELDSNQKKLGKKIIDDMIVFMEGDKKMGLVAEACGDDTLQNRLIWLYRKL